MDATTALVATRGIDWNKCIFCQKHLRSCKTRCPADSKRKDVGCGYASEAETVAGFIQLGHLPVDVSSGGSRIWQVGGRWGGNF